MLKKIILMCLVMMMNCSMAFAADLNAPAQKQVTIGSEINRGYMDVLQLGIKQSNLLNITNFGLDVERTIRYNQQQNTDTDAFLLGAYFAAWRMYCDKIDYSEKHNLFIDSTDSKFAYDAAKSYFKEFRSLQNKLNIDTPTLLSALKIQQDQKNNIQTQMDKWENDNN